MEEQAYPVEDPLLEQAGAEGCPFDVAHVPDNLHAEDPYLQSSIDDAIMHSTCLHDDSDFDSGHFHDIPSSACHLVEIGGFVHS